MTARLRCAVERPVGRLETKVGGGLGGNKGLRSVASALGTAEFHRLRVGIGRPASREPARIISYVLGAVPGEDMAAIEDAWREHSVEERLLYT
eukprot:SAG31_NODE_5216_length_2670_cov_1.605212_3_plen_93_part_00